MEFKENASVTTSDGKSAGHLQRVVLDPETNEVTHLVIIKGLLFKEDRVVDVQKVASATAEGITLTCTLDELKEMAPLEIKHYVRAGERYGDLPAEGPLGGRSYDNMPADDPLAGDIYAHRVVASPGTNSAMNPAVNSAFEGNLLDEVERTIPEGLVALKEGARVFSADNRPVGTLERVLTDAGSDSITQFTIAYGLLTKTRKTIPVEWVKRIEDDEIHLNVEAQQVTDLPDEMI